MYRKGTVILKKRLNQTNESLNIRIVLDRSGSMVQVDTTNILFICGGAFAGLDKIISQRDKGTSIGFGADVRNTLDKKTGEWMKVLEPEDLLKYGLIPEFIGRLPMIATLEDLDEKSLIKILQEPKNSLTKQYQELFKLDGAKLTFKDSALKEIALKAIRKKTGARGLYLMFFYRSKLEYLPIVYFD